MTTHTREEWKQIGRQVGRERGQLDHQAGIQQPLDKLWIPGGVDAAYVEGLVEGYMETVTGPVPQLGI